MKVKSSIVLTYDELAEIINKKYKTTIIEIITGEETDVDTKEKTFYFEFVEE